MSRAAVGMGGALSHAGGQIKNLITGPLGLIGLTGGLFGLGSILTSGIRKAQTFGDEVRQLAAVTGLSSTTVSGLAAAMEHFGIGADKAIRLTGFLEKNVGLLAAKKDGLTKFNKEFGLALTDQNGKLRDANALILQTADYFNNKSIPATTKAAALSKLYGRSWQDMIPFLKAGRQGIIDAEAEAARLGLTVLPENVQQLAELKKATREWDTALGGLQLQIGLALVPAMKDLATAATSFVSSHRTDIVGFFKGAAAAAKTAVGTIAGFAGAVGRVWDSIPAPFRDLLVKGIVADRTMKFLFGFSPIGSLAGAIEGGFAKAVGSGLAQAGLGKLFVQPVYVTNPGFGMGGGLPGAADAAGGMGLLAGGLVLTGVAAGLIGLAELIRQQLHPTTSGDLVQQFSAAEARAYHAGAMNVEQILAARSVDPIPAIDRATAQLALVKAGVHSLAGPVSAKQIAAIHAAAILAASKSAANVASIDRTRAAIIAASDKDRASQAKAIAKAQATQASLENLRHSMLSKQSSANALLAQIERRVGRPPRVTVILNNRVSIAGARYSLKTTASVSGGTSGANAIGGIRL